MLSIKSAKRVVTARIVAEFSASGRIHELACEVKTFATLFLLALALADIILLRDYFPGEF